MQVRKQQLELDMEQQTDSKSGKEYIKAVYYHPTYLTRMQSTSWDMPGWMKHKLESRLLGEISITSDTQMTPPLWQKVKSLLMKEEGEKAGLKLIIQKTKITTSGPITSWLIDAEITETQWQTLFLGLQNHCRWWLQPWNEKTLASWKKSYDQPRQYIKKQRHYFTNQSPSSQSYGFPVVM